MSPRITINILTHPSSVLEKFNQNINEIKENLKNFFFYYFSFIFSFLWQPCTVEFSQTI